MLIFIALALILNFLTQGLFFYGTLTEVFRDKPARSLDRADLFVITAFGLSLCGLVSFVLLVIQIKI